MKKVKDSIQLSDQRKTGGFRVQADDYNHIINDYMQRISLLKEANFKLKAPL